MQFYDLNTSIAQSEHRRTHLVSLTPSYHRRRGENKLKLRGAKAETKEASKHFSLIIRLKQKQ